MSDLGWLFLAIIVVWVGIGAYAATIGARQRRLERRIDDLAPR